MRTFKAWHGLGVSFVLVAWLGAACGGEDSTQLVTDSDGAADANGGVGSSGAAGTSGTGAAGTSPSAGAPNGPQDDLDTLDWRPSFEPDYNTLAPHPWV